MKQRGPLLTWTHDWQVSTDHESCALYTAPRRPILTHVQHCYANCKIHVQELKSCEKACIMAYENYDKIGRLRHVKVVVRPTQLGICQKGSKSRAISILCVHSKNNPGSLSSKNWPEVCASWGSTSMTKLFRRYFFGFNHGLSFTFIREVQSPTQWFPFAWRHAL